jgi:polyisoprenoid-binding protein YceI
MTSTSESKPGAVRYRIDTGRSRFIVKAFATGMLSAFAHNPTLAIRDFSGEVEFSPDAPEEASLHLKIKAGSVEDTDEISEKDRREIERQVREDVLESDRYPEIIFESTDVSANRIMAGQYRAKIKGNVTLRGLTRTCEMTAQIIAGPDTLRAHGEFPLKQSDFNIKPVSAAGGTIKLKDELKFTFDMVAHKIAD